MCDCKYCNETEEAAAAGMDKVLEHDDRVFVYTMGLCHCSVCAPAGMEREVLESLINEEHPTEISSQWTVSKEETFSGGQKNPSPCDQDPARLHYLMEC